VKILGTVDAKRLGKLLEEFPDGGEVFWIDQDRRIHRIDSITEEKGAILLFDSVEHTSHSPEPDQEGLDKIRGYPTT
jgi:hypothetical protein